MRLFTVSCYIKARCENCSHREYCSAVTEWESTRIEVRQMRSLLAWIGQSRPHDSTAVQLGMAI
jgi:hypothetical protein